MSDNEMIQFLHGVIGVVEATNFEKLCLWQEYTQSGGKWHQNPHGHGCTIGYLNNRPIHISLRVDEIDGNRILFLNATSQVIDYEQIENWLSKTLPMSAKKDGGKFVNKVDAMNFHNVLPRTELMT